MWTLNLYSVNCTQVYCSVLFCAHKFLHKINKLSDLVDRHTWIQLIQYQTFKYSVLLYPTISFTKLTVFLNNWSIISCRNICFEWIIFLCGTYFWWTKVPQEYFEPPNPLIYILIIIKDQTNDMKTFLTREFARPLYLHFCRHWVRFSANFELPDKNATG